MAAHRETVVSQREVPYVLPISVTQDESDLTSQTLVSALRVGVIVMGEASENCVDILYTQKPRGEKASVRQFDYVIPSVRFFRSISVAFTSTLNLY